MLERTTRLAVLAQLTGILVLGDAQAVYAAAAADDADQPQGSPLTIVQGSRLMIDARINGRPVHALLDSAAEATMLDRRFAASLKLPGGSQATGHGSGKESFEAQLVGGVTLQALGLTLDNQTVAVVDLSDIAKRLLKRPIEVILGRELFDAAPIFIDIEGGRIAVSRAPPPGVRLDLTTEHGVETMLVRVEQDYTPVHATFDLGNGSRVLLSAPFASSRHLLTDGRLVATESGGGLGGETSRQVFKLHSLEVAGRRFTDVDAAIDSQESASDVNIGVSILRHFRITTDFPAHAVWLDPR
jgi:hypothetical protein